MKAEHIEKGIELGIQIIEERTENNQRVIF